MTSLDATLRDLWTRLEALAVRHGATLALAPALSEDAIAAAEAKLGASLPAGYTLEVQRFERPDWPAPGD